MSGGSRHAPGDQGGQPGAGRADQRDQGATGLADRERRCTCGDRLNGCRVFTALASGGGSDDRPGVHVIGAEDLAAKFRTLADDIKGPALEAATRAAALPVLNQVRITEPEGGRTPYKTGTYVDRFRWRPLRRPPSGAPWSWGRTPRRPTTRVWVRRPGQARPRLQPGRPAAHPARSR